MRAASAAREEEPPLRAAALAGARRLFLQWGYAGTSIAMIAEALDVTKAALYYHFPDKEALFLAVFDEYLAAISADLAGLAPRFGGPGEPRAAFEALARAFLSRGPDSAAMQRLCFQESPRLSEAGRAELAGRYHRDLVRPLELCLERAAAARWIAEPRPGEPPRVWIFMGLLSAFFAPGHEPSGGSAGIDAEASALARILLTGLGAREGPAEARS